MSNEDPPTPDTPEEETAAHLLAQLRTIHRLTIRQVLARLNSDKPLNGSELRVVRDLLADNSITLESLPAGAPVEPEWDAEEVPFPTGSTKPY